MKKILALLLFVGASALYAQQKTHTVQAKETVYGISKMAEKNGANITTINLV